MGHVTSRRGHLTSGWGSHDFEGGVTWSRDLRGPHLWGPPQGRRGGGDDDTCGSRDFKEGTHDFRGGHVTLGWGSHDFEGGSRDLRRPHLWPPPPPNPDRGVGETLWVT